MKRNISEFGSNLSSNKLYSKIGKLLKIIHDLKECGSLVHDFSLSLPKICFVGPPSSGKSSIIESIIGIDFLPKGANWIITRRPIEIKLIHVPLNNQIKPYAELPLEEGCRGNKYEDFSKLRITLTECIENKAGKDNKISKEPIKISIYSNYNPDITIIDLPGVDDTIKESKEILYNYLKDESSIILYVNNTDFNFTLPNLRTNSIIKAIEEVDKDFSRTIGVLTKLDITTSNQTEVINLTKKLLNRENKDPEYNFFKNGFIAVKNRSTSDTLSTIEDNLHKEREYLSSHPSLRMISIDQFTIESLADKIKKLIYENSNVRRNLVYMHKSFKEKMSECQAELIKFGTDYIGYTNDTKNTYLTSLISTFCDIIERIFSGKMTDLSDNVSNYKLKGSYSEFLKSKNKYTPASNIKNEEIVRIIKQTEGDRLSGFPESEVIYTLLQSEMDILKDEIKNYVDTVNDLTRESIKNAMTKVFCRFPKLMDKIEELVNEFFEENFEKLKYLIDSVAEMNFNYLYIDEKSLSYNELLKKFVLSEDTDTDEVKGIEGKVRERSNTLTKEKMKIERERSNDKEHDPHSYYNGLAEYVKILINYFYSLMIRNLRENIPKATGYFFINNLKQNLRFHLMKDITREFSNEDFLEEDPEVAKRRNFFLNLMKVLKNCEKLLQYNEEIKFAIKGDNSKSIEKILENNFNKASIVRDGSLIQDGNGNNSHHPCQTNEVRHSTSIRKNSDAEKKVSNKEENKVNTETRSSLITTNKPITISTNTSQNTQTSQPKHSIQNLMKDEEHKKQTTQTQRAPEKEASISIKMDPNSSDLKDVKVSVNMDAETMYRLYQDNKKHLPTGNQMMSAAKSTANFVEATNNSMQGNQSSDLNLVTGNKPQKKTTTDPLTNLFGLGLGSTKKEPTTKPSNESTKKGFF